MFFWAAGRDKNENEDVTSCMFLWEEITRCGGGAGEFGKNIRNCLLINVIKESGAHKWLVLSLYEKENILEIIFHL